MKNIYAETISLCPECAQDSPSFHEEREDGVFLRVECASHGTSTEKVESDIRFFKGGYEREYERGARHLVFPVTYRCNLKCSYCYTLSNTLSSFPPDRSLERIVEMCGDYAGNITLLGGEPTVRNDLPELIRALKEADHKRKISVGTNGQRLADIAYLKKLKESGMDFVFLSHNDKEYDLSEVVYLNKMKALDNCLKLDVPVWLQRTVDDISQIDSMADVIKKYKDIVFKATIRTVKPFGARYPKKQIFVSDIIEHLKMKRDYTKGTTPFNCYVRIEGKPVKLCSWVNDVKRVDPVDSDYVVSDDAFTTFHRGMKKDELLLQGKYLL